MTLFSEKNHIISAKAPVADAFAGALNTDVIDVSEAHGAAWIVFWGVGATGTTVITVEACDDIVPTNTTAVAFKYRRVSDHSSSDVPGAITAAAAAGFTTTAGSNQIYIIEVDPAVIAATGYRYARLVCTESVDSPILGCVLAVLHDLRVKAATPLSAID